jgi:integrase
LVDKYYDRNGKPHYESSGSNSRADAERLLRKRLAEIGSGRRLVGAVVERTTFEELERLIVHDYQLRRRKSLDSLLQSFRALRRHFAGWRAIDIGYAELTHYASQWLSERKPATVRRELVLLHRAFVLGRGAEKRSQIPRFPTISVDNVRSSFFEPDEWRSIREHLVEHHQDACDFANLTDWRIMEVFGLPWADVDFQTGFVRLPGRKTESGRARSFPFRAMPELKILLERRRTQTDAAQRAGERIIPHVFHDATGLPLFGADQRPKKSFRRAWRRACLDAGYPGRIPHDFRRTVVRNLERSGVARSVAMELVGHRTEPVYQRYDIVAERDLAEGVARYALKSAAK